MIPVTRTSDAFAARVLVARLGSDGIVTQLRGGGVDGLYPMGNVEVLVSTDDLETARELLLADEVESALEDLQPSEWEADDGEDSDRSAGPARWLVLSVVLGLVLFAYVNTIGYQSPPEVTPERSGAEEPG